MTDGIEQEPRFLAYQDKAVHVTQDGVMLQGASFSTPNVTRDEIREAVGEHKGVDPSEILVGEEEIRRKTRGRNNSFAAFGIWNSSWEPGSQPLGDPSMN